MFIDNKMFAKVGDLTINIISSEKNLPLTIISCGDFILLARI